MSGSKRSFPYQSAVPVIGLKKRNLGGQVPGLDISETQIYSQPDLSTNSQVSFCIVGSHRMMAITYLHI